MGIFEEAHERDDVMRFRKRVNQTLLKLDGDPNDPIHLKAFDKAGCLGARVISTPDEVDTIPDEEFPVLMESHLDGWEFAVEAWVHGGKIVFLNISEYVRLGYSVFVPASPELEKYRPEITRQLEKLIKTFDIKFGFVHPEYFVTSDAPQLGRRSSSRTRPHDTSGGPVMTDIPKKVSKWPAGAREIGERLHAVITEAAPGLTPKSLWGAPGYARNGKVVVHFRQDDGLVTFGLTEHSRLVPTPGSGDLLMPTSWALSSIDDATEARVAQIVRDAVG